MLVEVGGTVGDIESLPFRKRSARCGSKKATRCTCTSPATLPGQQREFKTKPTQHSVAALRGYGIQPDGLILFQQSAASRCPAQDRAVHQR